MMDAIERYTQNECKTWEEEGLRYTEIIKQVYAENGASISGGFVEGHPIDTVYVRFERPGDEENTQSILLRPDEMAALAWVCNGVLFSELMDQLLVRTGG